MHLIFTEYKNIKEVFNSDKFLEFWIETFEKKSWIYILFSFTLTIIAIAALFYQYVKHNKNKNKFKDEIENQDNGFLVNEPKKQGIKKFNKMFLVNPKNAENGFVLKFTKDNWWVVSKGQPHGIIVGATESGKTQKVILPNIYYNSEPFLGEKQANFFILDPKGEIVSHVGDTLKKRGYQTFIIDINEAKHSLGWNPLEYIYKIYHDDKNNIKENENKALEELKDLLWSLNYESDNAKDSVWIDGSKQRLFAIGKYLLALSKTKKNFDKKHFNLASFYQFLSIEKLSVNAEWFQFLEKYEEKRMIDALNTLKPLLDMDTRMQSNYLPSMGAAINSFYNDSTLKSITSRSDFKIDNLLKLKKPFAIFLKYADNKPANFFFSTIIVDQLYQKFITYADSLESKKLSRPFYFILDEFGNNKKHVDFDVKVSIARSRDIHFLIAVQSYNQINSIYKDKAATIIDNLPLVYFLSSNDSSTLKKVSEIIGNKEIIKKSHSLSQNDSGKSNSESTSIHKEPVIPMEELATMAKNQILIKMLQEKPLLLFAEYAGAIWSEDKFNYKNIVYEFNEENFLLNMEKILKEERKIQAAIAESQSITDFEEKSEDKNNSKKEKLAWKEEYILKIKEKEKNKKKQKLICPDHKLALATFKENNKKILRCPFETEYEGSLKKKNVKCNYVYKDDDESEVKNDTNI
ncbi:type IV secretory system conjugative DNA transfer family protein [Candidatus Mycoplasma pogonae]